MLHSILLPSSNSYTTNNNNDRKVNWLNILPPELIKHSLYPFVTVSDIPSLFCICKRARILFDDNECWKEKFNLLMPKFQLGLLQREKCFESVWKNCLQGKIGISKTTLSKVTMNDVSYKKLVRSVFVDGKMSGYRLLNCGSHKDISSPPYSYILKTDLVPYESFHSIIDYYDTYHMQGHIAELEKPAVQQAKLHNVEFFTGKCFAMDSPESDNYIYFGISMGLYVSLFQIWHPSTDLITNVLGRKIVYKAHKKRDGQGKEELWTQEKNYNVSMRGSKGANSDLSIHGIWCDSINRSGFCSSENVNQHSQLKNFNETFISNKLLKINYATFDFEHEKNSISLLRSCDWKLSINCNCVYILKFEDNSRYVLGSYTHMESNAKKKGKVTGNVLDCYLSLNLIEERSDGVMEHVLMAVCEWTMNNSPKEALIVNTRGVQGRAILSPIK